jgi:hypothetical protein
VRSMISKQVIVYCLTVLEVRMSISSVCIELNRSLREGNWYHVIAAKPDPTIHANATKSIKPHEVIDANNVPAKHLSYSRSCKVLPRGLCLDLH